ncbi:hypothetical protein AB0C93_23880 [Streptomyces sp. NPDC048518]|uniref:hypothetical protein n=1 Tax=Streptomyces sp. NPDC048518 TaxID=3155029 RepID=UPI0033FA9FBA
MGIESDQLVFDYLSRVGDLAQQRQLPSGDRMRLVAELRNRIERGRSKSVGDGPVAVRRILARIGTPEEVVEAAGGAPGDVQDDLRDVRDVRDVPEGVPSVPRVPRAPRARPHPAVPLQRNRRRPPADPGESGTEKGSGRLRRIVPRPRRSVAAEADDSPDFEGAAPPHLAGSDELGPRGSEPDWWRVDSSPFGVADTVPGFVGGVEIPEILKPPPGRDDEEDDDEEEDDLAYVEDDGGGRRRWLWRPVRRGDGAGSAFGNPLLLLAAALLTVGAVLGNFLALGVGWLIAYASRRLSRVEAKFAVLGLPGLALAAGVGWLWGRSQGRWGDPIRDGHMSDAIADTWPWVVRGAAVASALFLLWRSQRQQQP